MELLQQNIATAHLNVPTVAFVAGDASISAQHAGLLSLPIALASMQLLMSTLVLPSTKLSLLMELASLIVHILPTFPMLIFNIPNAMMMIMKVILPK